MRDSREKVEDGWLSLRQASEKMGVSFATLRAWADEGRVQSYRTPGGHRRFRVSESAAPFQTPTRRSDARWRLLERIAFGRVQLAREEGERYGERSVLPPGREHTPLRSPPLNADQRELERDLIRLCVNTLQQALPTSSQKGQGTVETRAEELGQAYGKLNWRHGVSTRDAMLGLGLFRNAFVESVVEFAFGLGEPNVDELNMWLRRVNEIIDLVSVSMLEYRADSA